MGYHIDRVRWIVFRRLCTIVGLLYLCRAICMFVTQLPVADPKYFCSPKLAVVSWRSLLTRTLSLASGVGMHINGRHSYCGDYIYSGHTVVLLCSHLFIGQYSPKAWWPLRWLSTVVSASGVVLLLVSRGHYTVDVVIAYWITTRLFWTYHTLATHRRLQTYSSGNLLSNEFWFPLLRYMESGVDGRALPKRFDWPLPWPRALAAAHHHSPVCKLNI